MILDQQLIVCDGVDMSVTSPDYSTSPNVDLTLSPDLGSGGQLVAVVAVTGVYVAGSCTAVTIDIVTSSVAAVSTTPRVIGSMTILAADLESADTTGLDAAAHVAPFVIRANPDHGLGQRNAGTGVAERYLGLRFTHVGATSTSLFVTAYFTECFQGDPYSIAGTSGMIVV